jgi:hypothetical protein
VLRLTQLIIEYLLHVQNYLLHTTGHKDALIQSLTRDLKASRDAMDRSADDQRLMKKELHHIRKLLHTYQKNAAVNATNTAAVVSAAAAAAGAAHSHHTTRTGGVIIQPHVCVPCNSSTNFYY